MKETNLPLLTIRDLQFHKDFFQRDRYRIGNDLYNDVTVELRDESVKWATNLLKRNLKGEEFNFKMIYKDAIKGKCEDISKFECQLSLLQ